MIISHKYKCIFIRIPKCASTSIEEIFKKIDPDCISSNDTTSYIDTHCKASQLRAFINNDDIWNNYFKFVFIRNPTEWFVSQYTDNRNYYHTNNETLKFILNSNAKLYDLTNNVMTLPIAISLHTFLQFWLHKSQTNNIKYSISQSLWIDEEIDYIGTVENIDECWKFIKKKLSIPEEIILEKKNASHYPQKIILDDDVIKFIQIAYKKDFDLYNKYIEIL